MRLYDRIRIESLAYLCDIPKFDKRKDRHMKKFLTEKYGHLRFQHSLAETPNPGKFERHCHNSFELIYVLRGEGKYIVESVEYPLVPNTILLLRPYEYHYVCPQKDKPYERYVIHFSHELLLDAVENLSILQSLGNNGTGVYFPCESIGSLIQSQFEMLDLDFVADGEKSTAFPTRAETLLRTAVNQILLFLSYLKPDSPNENEKEWIGSVMRYLNENLSEDISLEDTAKRFFVSKYHLCHVFKEHTGISLFSYLTTKRIALAEQLLEDGVPASEVADRVGFRDYSVFYRAYRKQTGKSPSKAKIKHPAN